VSEAGLLARAPGRMLGCAMKASLAVVAAGSMVVVGCGGNHDAAPDASPDAVAVPEVVPGCTLIPQPGANAFEHGSDFGAAVPGTLAGWDPTGRWFLTGTSVGSVSSYHFAPAGPGSVIVDRDPTTPGTIDDTELFQHTTVDVQGQLYIVAKRVSNRAADGSLRGERAVCDGGQCNVCTAKLVRATHNADEGEGDHLALLGQLDDPAWGPGYTFNVRVMGTLAYLIRQDGLHVIETADPAHPVELGHYQRSGAGYSNDVKLVDTGTKRYALIADYPVDVVDVTDPAAPHLAGQITEQAHTVAVESRGGHVYAYFGNYNANCPIYDVTDPAAPIKLGSFHTTGQLVHDLSVDQGIAYLNAWDAGFLVVDFTDPTNPALVGSWPHTPTRTSHSNWTTTAAGRHIALHGEEAYGAHLDIVDLDPQSPTFMQSFAQWKTRDYVSIHNIMIFGTKAYFTYYQDGVRVLDVADPAHPAQLGYYNTWDPQADYTTSDFFEGAVGLDVDPARHLVFVADSPRGLLILQDTTPDTTP
jgi:hypothetical protein